MVYKYFKETNVFVSGNCFTKAPARIEYKYIKKCLYMGEATPLVWHERKTLVLQSKMLKYSF